MPVSSVKQRKAMKREQAIVHEALSSCFFFLVQFVKIEAGQVPIARKEVTSRNWICKIRKACFFFFFLTKNAWSFWAKRLDEENKIGKRVERQIAKLESICLGNGKNGCRARPATSTTPTKTPKQPLQQLTAAIQQASAEMTPLRLKEYRITVSCSDS